MTIAARPREANVDPPIVPCAVAWLDEEWSSVARMSRDGGISTSAIHRGGGAEPAYLELIVRVVGDAQRVVVLGPDSMRLALERAYVAIYRSPDRLVDVEGSEAVDETELIGRLRELAGTAER